MDDFINAKGQLERNAASTDRLDVKLAAMWELMLDKGFTREQLDAKLDKIKEQKITLDPRYNMEKNDPAACDKARRDSMNEVISFLREWDIS